MILRLLRFTADLSNDDDIYFLKKLKMLMLKENFIPYHKHLHDKIRKTAKSRVLNVIVYHFNS